MNKTIAVLCTSLAIIGSLWAVFAAETGVAKKEAENKKEVKLQTICPIMDGAINKSMYVDHDGKRIYVCCAGCINAIKKNPGKYIKKIEAKGITLAKVPPMICHKCGELKGGDKCCKLEGREKCKKCHLLKGSLGCCKLPADKSAEKHEKKVETHDMVGVRDMLHEHDNY